MTFKYFLFPCFVILYMAVIIIFDLTGFFLSVPPQVERLYGSTTAVSGKVTSGVEEKNRYKEFVIDSAEAGGAPLEGKFLVRYFFNKKKPEVRSFAANPSDTVAFRGRFCRPFSWKSADGFDYRAYLARKDIHAVINVTGAPTVNPGNPGVFGKFLGRLNCAMASSLSSNLPEREAGLLSMMFVGSRGKIPKDIKDDFQTAGVTHILVVSGLNVAYVVAVFYFLFRFLPVSNKFRRLLLAVPIILYTFVTGAQPPILRAGVMGVAVISCFMLRRESSIYHIFSLAALVILLFDPQALFGASFRLSFAACLGIVYIQPKLTAAFGSLFIRLSSPKSPIGDPSHSAVFARSRATKQSVINKILKAFLSVFLVSLSAQLAVAPLLAYYFSRLSLVGLAANIIAVPFSGFILWLCFALFFAAQLFPLAVPLCAFLCGISAKLLIAVVHFFSRLPCAALSVHRPGLVFIVVYYALLLVLFHRFFWKKVFPAPGLNA